MNGCLLLSTDGRAVFPELRKPICERDTHGVSYGEGWLRFHQTIRLFGDVQQVAPQRLQLLGADALGHHVVSFFN